MPHYSDQIAEIFGTISGVAAVLIFGSQAQGSANADSDVDVAVLFEHDQVPDAMALLDIRSNLEDVCDKSIDLVCLNKSSPIIGMQVYKYGKPVITPNQKTFDRYLMRLFTDYNDLKYLRKDAENAILERKYYG